MRSHQQAELPGGVDGRRNVEESLFVPIVDDSGSGGDNALPLSVGTPFDALLTALTGSDNSLFKTPFRSEGDGLFRGAIVAKMESLGDGGTRAWPQGGAGGNDGPLERRRRVGGRGRDAPAAGGPHDDGSARHGASGVLLEKHLLRLFLRLDFLVRFGATFTHSGDSRFSDIQP